MCKNTTFLKNIGFEYLPDMFPTTTSRKLALKYPQAYNIEYLTEIALATVGGYEFIDGEHCDFSDGSEAKTGSVRLNPTKRGGNSHTGEISNIVSSGGVMKSGDIRLCLYIPFDESIRYFFIPNTELKGIKINIHPTMQMGRIFFTYYHPTGRIKKLEKYEVEDFKSVATATS